MKKLSIIVSILLTLVLLTVGYKTVSAAGATYCVVTDTNTGFSNQDSILGLLESKVDGDLMNPENTTEALDEILGIGVPVNEADTEDLQAVGKTLGVDYVIVLSNYTDTNYDESLHSVNCELEIIKVDSDVQNSMMMNVIVAKDDNLEEEAYNALSKFIESLDPIHLN